MPGAPMAPPKTLALDAVAVLSHIADAGESRRENVSEALGSLARSFGLRDASALPVYIRAESFVGSLVRRW